MTGLAHPAALGGYFALVNSVTYLAFRHDKRRSEAKGARVPERTLLTLAIAGGWPAAKLAQRRFRHKTRKQPFGLTLNMIGALWGCALALALAAALHAAR